MRRKFRRPRLDGGPHCVCVYGCDDQEGPRERRIVDVAVVIATGFNVEITGRSWAE